MLSLSAGAPSFLGSLPGVQPLIRGIGLAKPSIDSAVKLKNPPSSTGLGALAGTNLIDFGSVSGTIGQRALSITNNSSTGLALNVQVLGAGAQGVTAEFRNNSRSTMTVAPKQQATVDLTSNPLFAGPIIGQLEISAPGLTPKLVEIKGEQAPYPAGAVTATPVARGAVDLSWVPSPSSGVAGYLITRAAPGSSTFQQVGTLTTGTGAVDHAPADGTYSYQIVAIAQGQLALPSVPGPVGSATSDSTAPAPPTGIAPLPPYLNSATVNDPLNVTVQLPNTSLPSDTITVTLTDVNGKSLVQTAAGGGQTTQVQFASVGQLADGQISVSATATDSVGNESAAFTQPAFTIDTTAPGAPASVTAPAMITMVNQQSVPIQVQTVATDAPTDILHISLSVPGGTPVTDTFPVSAADQPLSMDARSLPDGKVTVAAWVTDAANNPSTQVTTTSNKVTAGPTAPTSVGVAAGPNNPAGVVTAASQSAVVVQATFATPPPASDSMVFWVAGESYPVQPDGQSTTITLPPIDLSGLPDGTYRVGVIQTDANGNETPTFTRFTKDASGPTAPTSVGVPAGANNPAGYVNAATQAAAVIVASFAGPTDPADQISLMVGGQAFGSTQSGGSDQAVFTGDLSSLPDGTLPILGTITDANGVSTSFSGTLIKDTQAPAAPATAYVIGPPPNTISPADASCVKVAVAFNQAPDPSDTVTVTLSDGNTSVQGSAPAGAGQVEVGCIDASSLAAGNIAVNVTVTDAAGNSTSMAGTTATKLSCQPDGSQSPSPSPSPSPSQNQS